MPSTLTFEHYEVMLRDDGSICELGRGAMGITYKGFDTRLRVPVALKVINAAHLHSEKARQRFVREARSAAKLRHRNVASVFHLGQEADNYFYAMEFIDGETVDARLKRQGPLPFDLALQIAAQVARALNAAQAHELVHRDIKPANLMLVNEDDELVVKVIDFGLAKIALSDGEEAATLTMSGFMGTPHFASPEQLEEREIDLRSDIYSLGVTLWYLLTGKTPFTGSVLQVMSQHIGRPPPFEQLAGFPEPVVQLLRRMLEKNPADRQQTAAELRREIERCLKTLGHAAAPAASPANPATLDAPTAETAPTEAEETQFATGAALGGRFLITEQIGEGETGRVFRARDQQRQREVRLCALDRKLLRDGDALAQLERDAERLSALENPHLVEVVGLETSGLACYLTLEWIDGFSFRDLLRVRRELPLAEVLAFLPHAAAGLDAALGAHLEHLEVALPQFFVHFPEYQLPPESLLRRPFAEWPEFAVKFNALALSRDRFAITWSGDRTIVGGARRPGGEGADASAAVHEFAAVVYELLGGVPAAVAPGRYTPLAAIGEAGNEMLRRAFVAPESFASAGEFARLFTAPPENRPAPPIRTAAETVTPDSPPTEMRAPAPPPAIVEVVPVPEPPAPEPEPIIEAPAVALVELVEPPPLPVPVEEKIAVEPVPEPPVEAVVEAPPPIPEPEPEPAPVIEPPALVEPAHEIPAAEPAPPAAALEVPPPRTIEPVAPRRRAPLLATAALLTIAAGVTIHHFATRPDPGKLAGISKPTPPVPVVTPKPDPTPIPQPTPVPPPPPPTRMEMAIEARKKADTLEARQETREALNAWLALARDYQEFSAGKGGLQSLVSLLRNRPGGLPRAEFDALREQITEAAKLEILPAMLLLGEKLQKTEPEEALKWYSAAAKQGDALGMTQAALLIAIGVGPASDRGKVVDFLNEAARLEEPTALVALAQLHLSGGFGVAKDEQRAVDLMNAAADKGHTGALVSLGDYYVKRNGGGPSTPANKDAKKAFDLFSQAAERGDAKALRNLGVLYKRGAGVPQSHKFALQKFKEASEKGDATGTYYYAACLKEGHPGTAANPKEAKVQFRKAADKLKIAAEGGEVESMYFFASSLEQIDEIDRTKTHFEEMKTWYTNGASLGSQNAIIRCKELQIPYTPRN